VDSVKGLLSNASAISNTYKLQTNSMSSKETKDETEPEPSGGRRAALARSKQKGDDSLYHSAHAEVQPPKPPKPEKKRITRQLVQDLLDKLNDQDPELSKSQSLEKSESFASKVGAGTDTGAGDSHQGSSSKGASRTEAKPDDGDGSDIDPEWFEIYEGGRPEKEPRFD
jgi:hypothetical protein